jgi:hypothetical protein
MFVGVNIRREMTKIYKNKVGLCTENENAGINHLSRSLRDMVPGLPWFVMSAHGELIVNIVNMSAVNPVHPPAVKCTDREEWPW